MTAKRQRMRTGILIRVLPVVAIVLLALSWFNYGNMKGSLLNDYERQKDIVESHIVDAVTLIDVAYRALEIRLESEMSVPGQDFKAAYDAVGGNVDQLDLEGIKEKYGSAFDFFVIDKSTTITHGTLPDALNFSFSDFDSELGKKIDSIRTGDDIWYEQLRTNVVNGRLSKFSYIPVDNHQYLLEVSYSVGGFDRLIEELKPQNVTEALVRISPMIESIKIYDSYGYQLVDSGENYKPNQEILDIISKTISNRGFEEVVDSNRTRKTLFVELNSKRERTMANTDRIIEIIYNTTTITKKLEDLSKVTIMVVLLVLLFFCVSVVWFARNLTRPIEALRTVSGEISRGNYSVRAAVETEYEIRDLAESFNKMLDAINESFAKIENQNRALDDVNRSLEEKVAERTEEIISRNKELEEKNQELLIAWDQANKATAAKSSFLAMISHEIRTPINGIVGMSYLMQRTKLTTRQRDYISKMKIAADTLLEIINDVLDISKLEAGKTTLEKVSFSLEDVLEQVTSQVSYKASEKGLEMVVVQAPSVPDILVGDPLRLKQILANLMNNAVKFTESGEVVLATELLESNDTSQKIKFSIRDTGVGIHPEKLEKLFKPFQQADDSISRRYGGTGLGLSISRHFVELMNGSIWAESQPGNGSLFCFTAEFGKGSGLDVPKRPEALMEKRLKILVVDDSETTRETIKLMLHDVALVLDCANSGEEALERLDEYAGRGQAYDLVLMDWKLPGMDGIETATNMKRRNLMQRLPAILMITGYDLDEARKNENSENIDAFLNKPIVRPALIRTIEEILAAEEGKGVVALEKRRTLALKDPLDSLQILLAEDNPINQQIMRELLEQPNIHVDVVDNGILAIDAAARKNYDLVLMDVQMPEMDGLEAARRIRGAEEDCRVPIIAMTAHAMAEDRVRTLESGMDDYLVKPVDDMLLYEALKKWIPKEMDVVITEMEYPEVDEGPLTALKSFNTKSALRLLKGDQGMYVRLLSEFGEAYKYSVQMIESLIEEQKYMEARALVHGIRGVAGNLGAMELYIVAQGLESELAKGDETIDKSGFVPFKDELSRALAEIERVLDAEGVTVEEEFQGNTYQGTEELLSVLKKMLKDGRAEAKQLVPGLRHMLGGMGLGLILSELIKQIENIDFDEALSTVERLENALSDGESQ